MTQDIDRGPDVQIRDESHPVQTPSLELGGAELVPDELVRDWLLKEWFETELAPRPTIVVRNDVMQADLARNDHIVVEVAAYDETFTGHRHEFVAIEVRVDLEIRTIVSRQRMWNLMGETRRVLYRWILALQPYHSLYWDGFTPDYTEGPRNNAGTVHIRLTSDAVPIFTRRVTGEEAPNTDPSLFPGGI